MEGLAVLLDGMDYWVDLWWSARCVCVRHKFQTKNPHTRLKPFFFASEKSYNNMFSMLIQTSEIKIHLIFIELLTSAQTIKQTAHRDLLLALCTHQTASKQKLNSGLLEFWSYLILNFQSWMGHNSHSFFECLFLHKIYIYICCVQLLFPGKHIKKK